MRFGFVYIVTSANQRSNVNSLQFKALF